MKTNLYMITYPSGLVAHVHDSAPTVEALIRQMSGFTPEEAAEHGLVVVLEEAAHEDGDPEDPPPVVVNEHGQPPIDTDGTGPEPSEPVPPQFTRSRFQNVP